MTAPLIAIKGRFHAPQERYYALFLFILNPEAGYVETATIVVSVYSDLYRLEPRHSWREFENKINELKYHNQYSPVITADLQDRLKSLTMNEDFFSEVMKCVRANATAQLEKMLLLIFQRAVRDNEMTIETAIETVDPAELNAPPEVAPEIKPSTTSGSAPIDTGVTLNVTLVLAPVGGKPVTELKSGDIIMVRIVPMNERANFFIDTMKLRGEKSIKPCPMVLESLNPTDAGLLIRGRLDDNLYGIVTESEKVLVQLYEGPAIDKDKKENTDVAAPRRKNPQTATIREKDSNGKSNLPLVLSGAAALLLLSALAYMISSL